MSKGIFSLIILLALFAALPAYAETATPHPQSDSHGTPLPSAQPVDEAVAARPTDAASSGAAGVIATIPVGASPRGIAVNPITNRVYVAYGNNTVAVIDGASQKVIANIRVGSNPFNQIGVNSVTNRIYVPNNGSSSVSVIDGNTNAVIKTISGLGLNPEGVAVHEGRNRAYITHGGSNLSVIDGATNAISAVINTGSWNHLIAINPDVDRAYVSRSDPYLITVVNLATNQKIADISAVGFPDANPVTNRVYLAHYSTPLVTVIDGTTNSSVTRINMGSAGGLIAVNSTANCMYVTNLDRNTVSVISGITNQVVGAFAVGTQPYGVAVNSATGLVYVANFSSGSVSVIRDDICNKTTQTDAAALASQSDPLTVAPGAPIYLYIDVRNTGTTTWTKTLYRYNEKGVHPDRIGFFTRDVAPGETYRIWWKENAPTTPGVYDYGFMLQHGAQEFGPYFYVRVTVQLPSISGHVRDGSGRPIQGVNIDAGAGRTATTDASGAYTLSNLPVGKYTLTPRKANYLFVPPSHTVDAPPSWPNLDFTAVPYGDISVTRIEAAQVFLDHKVGTSEELPLIAGKQTMVRVYVKVNGNTPVAGMTARLHVRDEAGNEYPPTETVINGSVTATAHPDPSNISDTINFMPPAKWLKGTVTFSADILNQGQIVATSGLHQANFQSSRRLVVGIVPVKYRGQSVTEEQIKGLTSWAQKVYPNPAIRIKTSYPSYLYPDNLPIDCDYFADQLEDLYGSGVDILYALFPEGTLEASRLLGAACRRSWPEYPSPSGKVAYGEVGTLPNQRKQVFAHEVAHLLGRSHIGVNEFLRCVGLVNEYSDWPYRGHGIQAPGLDPADFAVKKASETVDYMSYCWGWLGTPYRTLGYLGLPAWTSPHTYRTLFDVWFSQLPPLVSAANVNGEKVTFVVSGIVRTDGTAALRPVWQRKTTIADINPPAEYVNPRPGTAYCAVATDSAGGVMTNYCFDLDFFDQHGGVSKPQDSFYLVLPNPGDLARVALTKNGIELAARQASAHLPTIAVNVPNGGEIWPATGARTIRWTAADVDGDALTYNVYYSRNGTDWTPVAVGIQDTQVNVDLAELGGGNAARVKVEVTDGVNTTNDVSDGTFSVAAKAPWTVILAPETGAVIPTGHAVLLQGDALSLEEGTLGSAAYRWSSNKDGELGTGPSLVAVLSSGEHTITLTATGGNGLSASAAIRIFVGAKTYLPTLRR